MKKKWNVSISAMIYRCDTIESLSSNQIKYLKNQMTARRYWIKEPLDNEISVEKPFAHKQAITLLLENNIVTPEQLVEEIGCYAEEIEQYCFLEEGILSPKADSKIIELKSRLK